MPTLLIMVKFWWTSMDQWLNSSIFQRSLASQTKVLIFLLPPHSDVLCRLAVRDIQPNHNPSPTCRFERCGCARFHKPSKCIIMIYNVIDACQMVVLLCTVFPNSWFACSNVWLTGHLNPYIDLLSPALHDLRIKRVQLWPPTTRPEFVGENCIDSNLDTNCRPQPRGPKASFYFALELDGPAGFEFDVKSVTIYTPSQEVEGYKSLGYTLQVSTLFN